MRQINPLVSIILPVYNVERYIRPCLDSVLEQSYKNIEIILVNDGSEDMSGSICDEYAQKDKRIKVIHKQNEGVSTARNIGIKNATGTYICFADSDDILQNDYVEYLLTMIIDNQVDIAVTTSFFTTFGGKQIINDTIQIVNGEDAALKILYYHIPIGCYCKIFKQDLLKEKNIYFKTDVYIGEGFNFNIEAFMSANKVAIGYRKIYCYRRNNDNSAMTYFKLSKAEMAIKAIQIIRSNLNTENKKLTKACDFADWHTHGDMYNWMVLSNAKKDHLELYNRCFKKVHSYAFTAMFAPINSKERFRAILQFIHPKLLAFLLKIRKWKSINKN